jgi:hypothetical protein
VPKHTGPISLTDTHLEPSVSRTRPTTTRENRRRWEGLFPRDAQADKTLGALQKAVKLLPDNGMGHYELGLALFETGDWNGAAPNECLLKGILKITIGHHAFRPAQPSVAKQEIEHESDHKIADESG